jgi:dipeptidyl aminopeptidase/acylaminoacyl peptidase
LDKTARLWDAATGKPIGKTMKHEGSVLSAQFSPDNQRVLTATGDNTARLWDAATGEQIGEPMKHEGPVLSAQFSPDGRRVLTASGDNTARLWDATTGEQIAEPMRHGNWVISAQFSPDGQQVVTASFDNTACLWDDPTITSKDTAEDMLLLADLAEATCGVALQTSGQTEILSLLTPEHARATRDKIAARYAGPSSKLTPLQRLMKWSVSERRSRTISPFSELTVAEWIENRITKGTLDGLRAAIEVDPANPRLAGNFGRRLADCAVEKGTDPDEARRERGEADFQTRRALKLAPDNDEVKKLRAEVVNLLQLSSE